jgi:hypothetical protein
MDRHEHSGDSLAVCGKHSYHRLPNRLLKADWLCVPACMQACMKQVAHRRALLPQSCWLWGSGVYCADGIAMH